MPRIKIVKEYHPVIRTRNSEGFSACALVGIHSVLLGWNMDESIDRTDFMGFAVNRSEFDPDNGELLRKFWLNGKKRFKGEVGDIGLDVRSDQGPFQRFRWSDYTVDPSRSYSYEIIPMFGKPFNLKRGKSLFLHLRPSPVKKDGLSIFSNRGVTAAFAYLERFGNQKPEDVAENAALNWLSRGLKESLLSFINLAIAGDKLKLCIYEFHDSEVAQALQKAKSDGVEVEIIYDAGKVKSQHRNEHLLRQFGLMNISTPRMNISISHNKFLIHLRNGKARSVWTASSNFSSNAFYKQTNQALQFEDKNIAEAYNGYFELIKTDLPLSKYRFKGDSAQYQVQDYNTLMANKGLPLELQYSPTSNIHVIDEAIEAINNARSAILVSSPFALDKRIVEALLANKEVIIEYGLVNNTAKRKIGDLKNGNSRFVHPSRLETYMGRSWDAKAFGNHKIHTKSIVIDPWSKKPTTIFGSANFSEKSCKKNDENMLISHDRRLAAVVATEFVRMYDHYRSRYFINEIFKGKTKQLYLNEDGLAWTKTAFDAKSNSFKYRDRLVFSGRV